MREGQKVHSSEDHSDLYIDVQYFSDQVIQTEGKSERNILGSIRLNISSLQVSGDEKVLITDRMEEAHCRSESDDISSWSMNAPRLKGLDKIKKTISKATLSVPNDNHTDSVSENTNSIALV